MLPKRNWAISVWKSLWPNSFAIHFWHFKLNKLGFGEFSTTNFEEFRNIMLSKNELARVKTILTTIKVQLKFGYFITCNGIPVVTTSSFNIFVRSAKWYRISRCIGLQIKKNTPKFRPSDNSIEKKISSIFVKLPVQSKI